MRSPGKVTEFTLKKYNILSSKQDTFPRILDENSCEVHIVSENSGDNNYPILCDNGKYYSINGKGKDGDRLLIYYIRRSPFADGRLVFSDITFAVRFRNFLNDIDTADCASSEELDYLKMYARELLDWQLTTANDKNELEYLKTVL